MQFSQKNPVSDEVTYFQNMAESVRQPFAHYMQQQASPSTAIQQARHMLIRSGTQEATCRKNYLLA